MINAVYLAFEKAIIKEKIKLVAVIFRSYEKQFILNIINKVT